jgi:hypothetical protein
MGRVSILGVMVVATAACGPRQAPRHSAAMESSAKILAQLDKLESELQLTDAENLTNAILVERHARAEQMACKVTDEHVHEIERLDAAQQKKLQEKHSGKRRMTVASR